MFLESQFACFAAISSYFAVLERLQGRWGYPSAKLALALVLS